LSVRDESRSPPDPDIAVEIFILKPRGGDNGRDGASSFDGEGSDGASAG